MAEAPAVSLFPSSPARFLFLSIIDILMGIPSGSLCGGESLASKEKLVRAGFGSYLKKCLTGTGGGCFVNTPATISLYLASICGKVRVVQVTLPLKITI